jgi:hypothetical protein
MKKRKRFLEFVGYAQERNNTEIIPGTGRVGELLIPKDMHI